MKLKLILFCLILIIVRVNAQKNVEFIAGNFLGREKQLNEALNNIKIGDSYFKEKNYLQCLPYYLKAHEFNPDNALLNLKIGKCYLETKRHKYILPFLTKAFQLDSLVSTDIHLLLGIAYQLNRNWAKAISHYEIYKTKIPPENWDKDILLVSKKIDECRVGEELMKDSIPVKIQNLGEFINSPFRDYSPAITADESILYFTSRRNTTTGGGICEKDKDYYEDIYVSYKEQDRWTIANNVGTSLNSTTNDAVIGVSIDGQKLIIYKDVNNGDIFESQSLGGDKWATPAPFPYLINTKYHESYATFSYDGNTLYFVSDRPENNFGAHDIFYCVKDTQGKWSDAFNIGPAINTPFDEAGVFMHPDGKTLFFSSKGHKNMGGYDIFKTVFNSETKTWSEPINLGYPINTPDDDNYVVVSADGKRLYYSSASREGFGAEDIYMMSLEKELDVRVTTEDELISSLSPFKVTSSTTAEGPEVTIVKGKVLDKETKQPLFAYIEITDNQLQQIIAKTQSDKETGKYLVALPSGKNYGIVFLSDGYLFYSENMDIPKDAKFVEINKDVLLPKIEEGAVTALRNILFDFDKYDLRPESYAEIKRIVDVLKKYSTMKAELSGYTDWIGTDEYNQVLSEKRAKAVYNELIKKGIPAKRLTYRGYGENFPVAPNANPDGTDNPEGRQLNRRTEFKILKM